MVVFNEGDDILAINPKWSEGEVLRAQGWFFWKDVKRKLKIDDVWSRELLSSYRKAPKAMGKRTGLKHVFKRYLVYMPHFAIYIAAIDKRCTTRSITKRMNAEDLLAMEGTFALGDVANILGLSNRSVLYVYSHAVQRNPKLKRHDVGFFRHYSGSWVVEMATFAPHYRAWRP